VGALVKLLVRPEDVDIVGPDGAAPDSDTLPGRVGEVIYLGEMTRVVVETEVGPVVARLAGRRGAELAVGDAVVVSWARGAGRVLPNRDAG
jgi:ABC-type Fe3+/spermidine/putrescine transport system ATPase subunit